MCSYLIPHVEARRSDKLRVEDEGCELLACHAAVEHSPRSEQQDRTQEDRLRYTYSIHQFVEWHGTVVG